MENLKDQSNYWDKVSGVKVFSHPIDSAKLASFVNLDAPILDYGCGQGRLCKELFEVGFKNTSGVDYSADMIQQCKKRYPDLNFAKVNGTKLPFEDGAFQVVLLFAVLTCIPSNDQQKELIEELHRVLLPGGILLISDYLLQSDERNISRYKQYSDEFGCYGIFKLSDGAIVRHHDKSWLNKLLKDFRTMEIENFQSRTMNGNPADIVQIWARKG